MGQDLAIALLGLAEPHLVFVEDAEVDQRGQRHGGTLGAPLVEVEGRVVVAEEVVDVGQLEQGPVVVLVEVEGLLELARRQGQLAVGGEDGPLLEVVFGR